MEQPCKGCTARYMACHGKCAEYIAWKAEHDRGKVKSSFTDADGLRADSIYRLKRKHKLK